MRIDEFLQSHGVEIRRAGESPHVREGWIGCVCPYCDRGQGNFGLGISLTTGGCSCWKCGLHPLNEVLHELTRASYEAIREFRQDFQPVLRQEAKQGKLHLPKGIGPLLSQHRRYLESRGFDPDELSELWGLQGIGLAPKLSWRIFIPIHLNKEIVSWTTRSIAPECPLRYRNAGVGEESISKRTLLYGADNARETCVVVEGPADAWAIGPGAVATLGLAYSRSQVEKISHYARRVICFDAEEQAQLRARKLCESLAVFPGETYVATLTGKDPASSPRSELREVRKRFLD